MRDVVMPNWCKARCLFIMLSLSLAIAHNASATVYSDASSGTSGWSVYDNTPPGARIDTVFNPQAQSLIIRTQGTGRANRYLLGDLSAASGWNNRGETLLSWRMAASEPYALMLYVETTRGSRQLTYNKSNANSLKNPTNDTIHFGLGSASTDGVWRTFQRDLAADVAVGEPGNRLLSTNGLMVLGSIRLDDIALNAGGSTPPEADTPPTASINASSVTGTAPLTVFFDAAGSTAVGAATVEQYDWDFGNGDAAVSAAGSTTYSVPRRYTASLTVTDSNGLSDTATQAITVSGTEAPPPDNPGAEAAARLLAQATFGATTGDIAAVERLGIEGWIDDQFTRQGTSHLDYVRAHPGSQSLSGPRQHKWLIDAIDGVDQLRQRVAFAYSEIFVTSDVTQTLDREQYAMANYYDLLSRQAFGNYRDLLEDVTLSPVMGLYLSMLQNARADPATNTRADENFAREVMQLFSIGLHELDQNGNVRRNSAGEPIPAYTQADVEEYARVFTGWNYADADRWDRGPADAFTNKLLPMRPFPGYHDAGQKTLLRGRVSPAGISAEADLDNALDSLYDHPNVGPFLGKQLIQRLVTSNPSGDYVARVAAVFNDNGAGVRGDMRAVIRAILLDTEARTGHLSITDFGKLREPLIRWTHLWRAFNVQRGALSQNNQYNHGSPYIYAGRDFLGQSVLSSASVFNFFRPDHAPLGPIRDAGLVAPESEIYSDAYILATTTRLNRLTQTHYQGGNANSLNTSYIDIDPETTLAANPGALLDRLDLLLLSGQMSQGLRSILIGHMESLPADEAGRSQRVRDGITLIMASPEYLVQK